jgi:hypothetical protein
VRAGPQTFFDLDSSELRVAERPSVVDIKRAMTMTIMKMTAIRCERVLLFSTVAEG